MDIFDLYSEIYDREKHEEMSLQDYLLGCRENPMWYANAPERMVSAIGEPQVIDTSTDERLGRCPARVIDFIQRQLPPAEGAQNAAD